MSESSDTSAKLIASHTVVLLNTQNPSSHSRCTGTLISNNVVLTAAHCIPEKNTDLWIVTSKYEFALLERHAVTKIIKHDLYKTFDRPRENQPNYDLALVQFAGKLPENYTPSKWVTNFHTAETRFWLAVAGYGETKAFAGDSGELRLSRISVYDFNSQNHYFKADQGNGFGICKGDSGGPVFIQLNDNYLILGVVSGVENKTPQGGTPSEHCRGISYFNSTIFYQHWIETSLNSLH